MVFVKVVLTSFILRFLHVRILNLFMKEAVTCLFTTADSVLCCSGKWSLHEPRASWSSHGNLSLERPKIFLKCRKYNGLYFLTSFWCLQANSSIMEFLFFQPLRFKRLVGAMYFHNVILWDLSLAIKDN